MKKVIGFMLLLLFLVGVGVPDQAKAATETTADDVKYTDIEDFMHTKGYTDFSKRENCLYMAFSVDKGTYPRFLVMEFEGLEPNTVYACTVNFTSDIYVMSYKSCTSVNVYKYYLPEYASMNDNYNQLENSNWNSYNIKPGTFLDKSVNMGLVDDSDHTCLDVMVYSDVDIYYQSYNTSNTYSRDVSVLLFESCVSDLYTFPAWCQDANLNALSSSNESPSKIPYSYNSYWHIVRKTSNGKWLLTTIGNSVMAENPDDYKLYFEDGNLVAYSIYGGNDNNGYLLNVRQYEYDTDGWKVRTYDTYDFRETSGIIDLGSGSGFDDTRKLAYNNVGIYTDSSLNPTYPVSTEYYEITTPDVPDDPTPTSTPAGGGSGSGSSGGGTGGGTRPEGGSTVGGQAEPGGMLDFIITFFTMVWIKLFAVEVPVDGYNISFQSIVIFGAVAGVLIWLGKISFGKKG